MTFTHALVAVVVAGSTLVPPAAPSGVALSQSRPRLSTRDLVAAATRYATDYRREFAFLVADEIYMQTQILPGTSPSRQRTMRGELFLTYLAADDEWIAVHDIAEVDGDPVPDREDLRQLMRAGAELRGVVGKVAARNARFNIGNIKRNFNEPMLPLLLLGPDRVAGIQFDRREVTTDGQATLATLEFRERDRPTLVRGTTGPIRSRGEMTIEADSGRIRRTVFELNDGAVHARLTTVYGHEEKLDLWVPTDFTERYELSRHGEPDEVVTGTARYTNYRRFSTSGRVKN